MQYQICRIKNISGGILQLHEKEFEIDEIYIIPDSSREGWSANDDVILAITTLKVIILNEVSEISGISNQIDYLKSNFIKTISEVIATPPYAEPLYRTRMDASPNIAELIVDGQEDEYKSSCVDVRALYELYVSGGELLVENAQFGDYVSAEIYDKDGIIPEPYRGMCENHPTVARYVLKRWVAIKDGQGYLKLDTRPLNAKISVGLYLRITYFAKNIGQNRKIVMSYDLTVRL